MLRYPAARAVVVCVVAFTAPSARAAIEGDGVDKSVVATRVSEAPVIDGDLGDAVWSQAAPDDRFTQRFPDENKPPTQRTELRVVYDDRAIYVGVRLHDTNPEEIEARLTRRDRLVESDSVAIGIDSRHSHHSGYVFQLNAAGVQSDALLSNDSVMDFDWDAVWDGAAKRDAGGWSAEFSIPLTVLRFDADDTRPWGFQVHRYLSRRQELDQWAFVPRGVQGIASRMGHLVGLRDLRPRRAFELRPFAVSRLRARTDSGGALFGLQNHARFTGETDVGVDLKIGITSDLTLDATLNPDFGQVEADQVVLNLSRFETFFPEKRPFFLEGKDIYATPVQMFYSRRIGRPPSGKTIGARAVSIDPTGAEAVYEVTDAPTALPIYAAGKLTGKPVGELSVGALTAVTAPEVVTVRVDNAGTARDEELAPARSYSVLRLRYALGGNSYVGLLGTSVFRLDGELRRASANHDAITEGIDGQWQSSDGVWRIVGQLLATHRLGGTAYYTENGAPCHDPSARPCYPITRADGTKMAPGDDGYGVYVRAFRRGKSWIGDVAYEAFSPKLDPNDMGFLTQFNMHRAEAWSAYQDTSGEGAHQYVAIGGGTALVTTFDGVLRALESWSFYEGQLKNFWFVSGHVGFGFPGGWDVFETGDGARFETPPGMGGGIAVSTDSRKRIVARTGLFGGAALYQGGWDLFWEAGVTLKPFPQWELELAPQVAWAADSIRAWFIEPCVDDAGAPCTVDTVDRHYVFARLNYGTISMTARSTYTFSPRLSLQGYAQLFLSQGEFHRYYRIDTVGTNPEIRRDDLVEDPMFDAGDDDFQDATLNVNLVLRWEPALGTTVLAVYTRNQNAAYDLTGRAPRFQLTGLDTGPAEDIFLLKLTYFVD